MSKFNQSVLLVFKLKNNFRDVKSNNSVLGFVNAKFKMQSISPPPPCFKFSLCNIDKFNKSVEFVMWTSILEYKNDLTKQN